MPNNLDKRFDNQKENEIYAAWEKSGYFSPDACVKDGLISKDADPFSISLPPPNVTGTLHMGHAAMLVLEDIMVRYNRMCGKKTLWLPGTDHAAIATQSKVEKIIYEAEEKTRFDLGREEFLKRVEKFASESHDTIVNQMKKMGASVDWEREAFTLDEKRSIAVTTAFKKMYDLGLIYQGERIVNWDPKMKTTVSDDEIEWKEETVPFYYIKYGPFTIATARPETKFGDKYVVMHPDDSRYDNYKDGEKLEVEWINGPIIATVIKDKAIDMEFGSGVMTITPWHDAVDFDISERHNLEREQIIDLDGKLLPIAGAFSGLHIKKARTLIVEKLKEKGLLVKVDEKYTHRIAVNSRGGGVIEPQILRQWFVAVNKEFVLPVSKIKGIKSGEKTTLKKLMRTVVESGEINIIPEHFQKIYFHWIDNLRDWCISRQIWYGHRIPVWYKDKEMKVGENPKEKDWEQDPDTLDTWFSSGLWTFSTLGWPEETNDFKTFHPTSVLETGYDILFFWVARMILMSTCLLGEIPFKKVYLHGLVRDAKGRKMSKSLGNGIDPLDMIEKYGADATRLSLIIGTGAGNDTRLSEDKVKAYRNFTTKIWNVARFAMMNKPENYDSVSGEKNLTESDKKHLETLSSLKKEITAHFEKFEFHLAGEKSYAYFWHTFADVVIEEMKSRLKGNDTALKNSAFFLIESILLENLKMLHPFMPFVTEEIYQSLLKKESSPPFLMVEKW
ncbi:MAG: valine--tRNA ligase [Candidatus Pacebacteria bacterium]|nr:valine--tRNA ligase [Candidatus Paceibacterota bacterium]